MNDLENGDLCAINKTTMSKVSSPVSSIDGVIPAKAGIQAVSAQFLDARLRGHDDPRVGRRGFIFEGISKIFAVTKNITGSSATILLTICLSACAPRVIQINPAQGAPGSTVSLSMEYLVGWPRVEISGTMMDWHGLKLLASNPERKGIPGEELIWIEDKILQFAIPDLPPGDYTVTIHDDKGPPGDLIYSFLETTAYLAFPPVWPFVLRSNQTQVPLRVLPR